MYLQYTPSSKRNLSSWIWHKFSSTYFLTLTYYFHVTKSHIPFPRNSLLQITVTLLVLEWYSVIQISDKFLSLGNERITLKQFWFVCLFDDCFTPNNISSNLQKNNLHHLRALSAKNANHLQTTDTLKRHQRYSIHYHCGWPSLGIWGSATHNGLTALPEPFLRACGLHRVCTGYQKIKTAEPFYDVQGDSMYESTWKSRFWKNMCSVRDKKWQMALFQVDSCIQFYRLMQLAFFNIT